jgi:hypothetical protein
MHTRIKYLAVAMALAFTAVLTSFAPPATLAASGSFTFNLYRAGIFVRQPNWDTCNPTVVRMAMNIINGTSSSPSVTSLYAEGLKLQVKYAWPGLDPVAQAALLQKHAGGNWTIDNATSYSSAVKQAAKAMALTHRPVALFVAAGSHSWLLNGFTATADPQTTDNFTVTGVYVTGPLWGLQDYGSTYYDMPPNSYLSAATFAHVLTAYNDHGLHNAWYGHYVTVNPVPWQSVPVSSTYISLPPARLLDTRIGNGLAGAFIASQARTFQVTGRGGVPANADAVTGNLTVTAQTAGGYLALTPVPDYLPSTSTLNFPVKDDRANGVTALLSNSGSLSLTYVATGNATAQAVFDVTGYFVAGVGGATYYPLAPDILLDTSNGTGLVGPMLKAQARSFAVVGQDGIPTGAVAVTGNLTVSAQSGAGYLALTPTPTNAPSTSTLNFPASGARSNGVTAQLAPDGSLAVVLSGAASANAAFDVTGYFMPNAGGASYTPLAPVRLLDTRSGNGLAGAFTNSTARSVVIAGRGGIPATAVAITANATVTAQTAAGYVAITADPTNTPTTSTVNFPLADNRASGLAVPLSGGSISATFVFGRAASSHLVLDVTGYFMPPLATP